MTRMHRKEMASARSQVTRVITPREALQGRRWAVVSGVGPALVVYDTYLSATVARRTARDLNETRGGYAGGIPYEAARIEYGDGAD